MSTLSGDDRPLPSAFDFRGGAAQKIAVESLKNIANVVIGEVASSSADAADIAAVELVGRYRHAPLRAALNRNGVFCILIDVVASRAAYFSSATFSVFDLTKDAEQARAALTAGFASLVLMRSSFFKARVGASDIGIGPAAILDALPPAADRARAKLEQSRKGCDSACISRFPNRENG